MLKTSLFLASAAFVAAQSNSNEPCAEIASLQAEDTEASFPAQTAFDCLNSVPVDEEGDSQLIDELKNVWQWQSEVGWLKKTPDSWEYGPIDLESELDKIKGNLGNYNSEYEVQIAIQNLTTRTGNFHFNYQPDILQIFRFRRSVGVASISTDGTSLPKLYIDDDVTYIAGGGSTDDVSEISEINGEKPYDYLHKIGEWDQYIDSDGRMNNLFTKGDTSNYGSFTIQTQYDGVATNITFANGTTASADNYATTDYSFSDVSDGKSFFDTFCTGQISGYQSTQGFAKSVLPSGRLGPHPTIPHSYHTRNVKRQIPSTNYADAVVEAESGAVAGYFLKGDGFDDVAVLKIITFAPNSTIDENGNEFQATVKKFLSEAVDQKKQKLIIDLRENGGGATHLLLDTFMQLFPDMEPFSAQRYRAQDQFITIGNAVSELHDNATAEGFSSEDTAQFDNTFRYWAYWHFVTAKGENFKSWDEFNGPLTYNDDSFTDLVRYNYSNSDDVSIRNTGFFFVNGTRPTPFKPENVIMYTDALCGSSCASFHEELKNIAGVHAVTVGGRPENKPIQTVTGTKGGEVIPLNSFPEFADMMLNISEAAGGKVLAAVQQDNGESVLQTLSNSTQLLTRVGDSSSRLQTQDQIRKGDKTATPLQYIYEAADCRIFYTAETYADPDAAWKQAWSAFSDDSKCVQGSTKDKSSLSGGYKAYGAGQLQDSDVPEGNGSGGGGSGGKSAAPSVRASSALVAVVVALVVTML